MRKLRLLLGLALVALAVSLSGTAGAQAKASKAFTVSVSDVHSVTLNWTASTSSATESVTYSVYRSTVSGGPYTRIVSGLNAITFLDMSNIQSGQTYFYVVTTVDAFGNESVNSNEVAVAVPIP